MTNLGKWSLKTACLQAKNWMTDHKQTLAVNLSSTQLIKGNLQKIVQEVLAEAGLLPSQLELELTETSIMVNPQHSNKTLQDLHDLGIRIAVDDFGTGYSSLSYLKSLPIDTLKIDQTFISDIENDENSATIVKTIIGLGHNMNLNVIAEGVETEKQLEFLKKHDCDQIQGFFFSKPLTADEMTAFLQSHKA
jgi:EAL domain-containing protein (putative c-di-GMP-specific phosphodiesterase class I)